MRSCVGPIHWPPTSTTWPSPSGSFSVLPPTRSRASSTTGSSPLARSSRAAVRPASPAPTMATSASRVRPYSIVRFYQPGRSRGYTQHDDRDVVARLAAAGLERGVEELLRHVLRRSIGAGRERPRQLDGILHELRCRGVRHAIGVEDRRVARL